MPTSDVPVAALQEEISRLRELLREVGHRPESEFSGTNKKLIRSWRHRASPVARYAAMLALITLALVITVALKETIQTQWFRTPFFFCAIVLSSWLGGFGTGICATILSVFLVDYLFTDPRYILGIEPVEIPRFAVFFLAGTFISWLGGRQRQDEEALLRTRAELEEKVLSRTRDLQQANERLKSEIEERVRQMVLAENRTESVMRATRTIPSSLSSLGEMTDVDSLLGEVLSVIVEYLKEEGGSVWLYDDTHDRLRIHLVLEDGALVPATKSEHPGTTLSEDQAPAVRRKYRSTIHPLFRDNVAGVLSAEDIASQPQLAPYRDYLKRKGVKSLLCIPLMAGDDFLGMISVRCRDETLLKDEISFVQAIAIHASLALKMSGLAEMERQAIVAEERREAIARSKEALGRITSAGRATLQRLAEQPDLTTFLDHVLAVSIEQLGAVGAGVWLGNPSTGICSQYIYFRSGDTQHTVEPGFQHHIETTDAPENGHYRPAQGRIVIHREAEFEALTPYKERFGHAAGSEIRTLMRIPLFFGAEGRGILTLHFASDRTLTAEEDGLAHTLANQVALALELTKLSEKAQAAALADERNRMAADVHDTLAQAFAATLLHLRSMKMDDASDEEKSHWKFAQGTAAEGLAAARRAMNAVRSALPADERTLVERLEERVRQTAARMRPRARVLFQLHGSPVRISWAVEDELLRLASEALFNAERHSAALTVEVELDYLPDSGLRVTVRDNGRGFDQSAPGGAGLGLRSMQERAERIGANLTLITESGRGTEIVVLWNPAPDRPVLPDLADTSQTS